MGSPAYFEKTNRYMKALFTGILCLLIVSIQAQPRTAHASHLNVASWSTSKKDWVWGGWKDCDVNIVIKDKLITLDNSDQSVFITRDVVSSSKTYTLWRALDKDNTQCYIRMRVDEPAQKLQFYITYSDLNVLYELDE